MDQKSHLPSEDLGEPSVIIGQALVKVQDAAATLFLRVRLRLAQSFTVFSIILLLLWIAAFLYGSFYYSYMPRATFSTPIYYYYRTDCESSSFLCSYPVANVSLMRDKKHVLTYGQVYRFSLQLEMPDSQTNQDLGMFMIKTTCYSQRGQIAASARSARQLLKASSSRFGMLRYRSDLLKTLGTLLFLPFFLTGAAEQKQVLEVELFSEYIDDPYAPSVTAFIEILSSKVQIYASELYIYAHFTGLRLTGASGWVLPSARASNCRPLASWGLCLMAAGHTGWGLALYKYLLFQFPIISAFVGVSTNFIFLSFLFILSYTRQLLRVGEKPGKLTRERLEAEMEEIANNHSQDDKDVVAGTAELMGPEQSEPTDPDREEPSSHTGNNTEMQNGDTLVQG